MAVTATSTPQVESDLCNHLRIDNSPVDREFATLGMYHDQGRGYTCDSKKKGGFGKDSSESKSDKLDSNICTKGVNDQAGIIRVFCSREHVILSSVICSESDKFNEIVRLLNVVKEKISSERKNAILSGGGEGGTDSIDSNDVEKVDDSFKLGLWSKPKSVDAGTPNKAPKNASIKFPHTIIYCWRKVDCERLSQYLIARGYPASFYHGSLTAPQRQKTLQAFRSGSVRVLACSIALSLGLDLPQTRAVFHLQVRSRIYSKINDGKYILFLLEILRNLISLFHFYSYTIFV